MMLYTDLFLQFVEISLIVEGWANLRPHVAE